MPPMTPQRTLRDAFVDVDVDVEDAPLRESTELGTVVGHTPGRIKQTRQKGGLTN
jgi:hypothetical protein